MSSGFDNLSLAIFTTLSPAGIVAFICAALPLLLFSLEAKDRERLNHYLAIPYAVVLVGFIASATHLGTPSNALHVFSGVGRSPLSNEVLVTVIFLVLAGAYWMFSFKENFPLALARLWLGISCLAGLALVYMTSQAYSVETVITWSSWLTPVNLWLSALLAGPPLGILTCMLARLELKRYFRVLGVFALLALIVGSLFLCMHYESLASITNYEFSALDLLPQYPWMIAAHILLGVAALAILFVALRKSFQGKRKTLFLALACLVMFVAVFIPRIAFYTLHMTAGF